MRHYLKNTVRNVLVVTGLLCLPTALIAQDKDDKTPPPPDHSIVVLGQELGTDETSKRLEEVADQIARGESTIKNPFKNGPDTFSNVQQGISGLFLRSLALGSFLPPRNLDRFEEKNGDPRCKAAKDAKIEFHEDNGGIPVAFGKIIDLNMVEYHLYWAGSLTLCTWVATSDAADNERTANTYDEYVIHLDFRANNDGTLRTHVNTGDRTDPFPGTLAGIPAEMIEKIREWGFKIHGTGDAIQISAVWKNGAFLNPAEEPTAYINDENCFDFFLETVFQLTQLRAGVLPEQAGYCLGRCDGLIMNTK